MDLALLQLWCRPAVAAQIQPLAWEFPYATGGRKRKKKKAFFLKTSPKKKKIFNFLFIRIKDITHIKVFSFYVDNMQVTAKDG